MKLQCVVVLVAFSLFSPSSCDPEPIKVNINNHSSEIFDATTFAHDQPNEITTVVPKEDTTLIDGDVTIPVVPTLPSDITTTPTSSPTPPTTVTPANGTTASTTPTTTTKTTATPVTKPTSKSTSKPTEGPNSTEPPAPNTTASPHSKGRQFDGPSFIGGIVLACGLTAIGFVAFKFYKARTERNYHTL